MPPLLVSLLLAGASHLGFFSALCSCGSAARLALNWLVRLPVEAVPAWRGPGGAGDEKADDGGRNGVCRKDEEGGRILEAPRVRQVRGGRVAENTGLMRGKGLRPPPA